MGTFLYYFFEAGVLVLFGAILCDILLDQLGLKIGYEIMFQNSSCSNFIKVLCSINSLLKLKYLLKSLNKAKKDFKEAIVFFPYQPVVKKSLSLSFW